MNDMTNKSNAKPAKPETFTINITEEYVRECNQLDQEYRDKACRLYAEYSRKKISIDRRFSNKKASNTNNLFQPRNVESSLKEFLKNKSDDYIAPLIQKYTDCEKFFSPEELKTILGLLENNFNEYVPNWANIAMVTQHLPDKSPNEGERTKTVEWNEDQKKQVYVKAIREIRLNRKMSLEDIGEILGYSRQYMSKIEHGKIKTFPAKKIPIIAEKLDVSPAYLLGLVDDERYVPPKIESFFWEYPDILKEVYTNDKAKKDTEEVEYNDPDKLKSRLINYVKNYLQSSPDDSPRFIESKQEKAKERLKTIISDIKDSELIVSLEKLLYPGSLKYDEAVAMIKALSRLCDIPNIGYWFQSFPIPTISESEILATLGAPEAEMSASGG